MIKLVIFDMDGVLADLREVHYNALNAALQECGHFPITRSDHLARYDGLPTKTKLMNLGIKDERVAPLKQKITQSILRGLPEDEEKIKLFRWIMDQACPVAVASNSVRSTVDLVLNRIGVLNNTATIASNEDVSKPKPSPAIYLHCMAIHGVGPSETLIVEDSATGRKAAAASGAHVLAVTSPEQVTLELLQKEIKKYESAEPNGQWDAGDLNVLIPMAGSGSRFAQAGYTFPKPLIDVAGKPMIQRVVENLNLKAMHIFIVQEEHIVRYNIHHMLSLITTESRTLMGSSDRRGAAWDTMGAELYLDNDQPLLIANSDQIVDWDVSKFMWSASDKDCDGLIATFKSSHPKWSYAEVQDGRVVRVAEKDPISEHATVGIYYWKRGSDYFKYARQMIEKNITTNGEFYVCPVYNEAIMDGKQIRIFEVDGMHGLGTPEDLQEYLRSCC